MKHDDPETYFCHHCEASFRMRLSLLRHLDRVHVREQERDARIIREALNPFTIEEEP